MHRLAPKNRILGAIVPLSLLLIWELASRNGLISQLFFPPPSMILARLWQLTLTGSLPENVGATVGRVVVGVLIGGGLGLMLGLSMGISARMNAAADGLVSVTHPLPKIALLLYRFMSFETHAASA
jgi:ABC-type nitrate/sulfonate/bicarbonate transport system permease component